MALQLRALVGSAECSQRGDSTSVCISTAVRKEVIQTARSLADCVSTGLSQGYHRVARADSGENPVPRTAYMRAGDRKESGGVII